MQYNNAIQIKRDILFRTTKAVLNQDYGSLDRIPIDAVPRGKSNIRCCIHKDRAVTKYRVMANLGYSVEDEVDELKSLSSYASDLKTEKVTDLRTLTVIGDACRSCTLGHHYISDVCVGCVARPCTSICPKDAINVINGRSIIDKEKCIDCGRCTTVCPYNAVVKVPVPCEFSCPVDALKKDSNNIARIDINKCISCGRCIKSCPFGAIAEKSQLAQVIELLHSGKRVNALIAPSIAGQFPGSLSQIKQAVKTLGYADVIDVAEAAAIVADREAVEFMESKELMTSSCCPSYIDCIEKHVDTMKTFVSHTDTPMVLSGKTVRETDLEVINVFIGPCLAKKIEALKSDVIDYVLTFEELGAHLMAAEVDVQTFKDDITTEVNKAGYGFAKSGGVLSGVSAGLKARGIEFKGETLNGLDKKEIKKLKIFNKIPKNYDFLEVMACEGGCLNGPGVIVPTKVSSKALDSL